MRRDGAQRNWCVAAHTLRGMDTALMGACRLCSACACTREGMSPCRMDVGLGVTSIASPALHWPQATHCLAAELLIHVRYQFIPVGVPIFPSSYLLAKLILAIGALLAVLVPAGGPAVLLALHERLLNSCLSVGPPVTSHPGEWLCSIALEK